MHLTQSWYYQQQKNHRRGYRMDEREAILGLMMSERMKAALITANNLLTFVEGLPAADRKGGEMTVGQYIAMLASEVGLAERVSPQEEWTDVARLLERAQVKIDSGIASEATGDIAQAISRTVTVSNRTMTLLQDKGLL
jgi:hypothetical protein